MTRSPLRIVEDVACWLAARSWSGAFSFLVYFAVAKWTGPLSAHVFIVASGSLFAFGVVCLIIGLAIVTIRAYRGESFKGDL